MVGKKKRNAKKDIISFTAAAAIAGVGAEIVGSTGGNAAAFSGLGRGLKPLGTAIGGGFVLGAVRDLLPEEKKKKRRRR